MLSRPGHLDREGPLELAGLVSARHADEPKMLDRFRSQGRGDERAASLCQEVRGVETGEVLREGGM